RFGPAFLFARQTEVPREIPSAEFPVRPRTEVYAVEPAGQAPGAGNGAIGQSTGDVVQGVVDLCEMRAPAAGYVPQKFAQFPQNDRKIALAQVLPQGCDKSQESVPITARRLRAAAVIFALMPQDA